MNSVVGFFIGIFRVAGFTIARLRRSRLTTVLVLGLIVGAVVTFALATFNGGRRSQGEVFVVLGWWALSVGLLPWVGIFLGVTAVHGDLEDQTCQYLFLTPVSRPAILLGKWLGAALVAAVVAVLASATVYCVLRFAPAQWGSGRGLELRDFAILAGIQSLGMGCYVAVAALSGAWFKRPLVWAILYVVGVENIMANLPASAGLHSLTISDPMRRMLLEGLAIDSGDWLFVRVWPTARFFSVDWVVGQPMTGLFWFLGIVLAFAVWIYCRREYGSRQD